jgi:hypothetical protein
MQMTQRSSQRFPDANGLDEMEGVRAPTFAPSDPERYARKVAGGPGPRVQRRRDGAGVIGIAAFGGPWVESFPNGCSAYRNFMNFCTSQIHVSDNRRFQNFVNAGVFSCGCQRIYVVHKT